MAKKINLIKNGIIKEGYVGFSWTSFFFGFFVPLFRKDWITAGVLFLLTIIVGYFTAGLGPLLWSILLGFGYNKYYTKNLIEKEGYLPASDTDSFLLQQHEIFVKATNSNSVNSASSSNNNISDRGQVNTENSYDTIKNNSNQVFTHRVITENIHLTKGDIMNENSKTNQYDVELEKLKLEKSTDDTKYMRDIIEKNATNEHDANISAAIAEVDKLKVDVDKTKTLQGNQESRDQQLHEQKMREMELELEKMKLTGGNQEARDLQNNSKNKIILVASAIVTVTLIAGSAIYFRTVNSMKIESETVTKLQQINNEVEMTKATLGNQESRDAQAHEAEMKKMAILAEQEKLKLEQEIQEAKRKAEAEALAAKVKAETEALATKRKIEAEIAETKRKRDAELARIKAAQEKEAMEFKILNSIGN